MNRTIALLLGASLVGVVSCVADPEAPGKLTDCSLRATPGARVDMPVGSVRVFGTAQSIGCEILPTTPNAEYLFVVSNASSKPDDEKRFTFVAGPDTTQALATSASLAISPALVADRSGGLESDRVSQQLGVNEVYGTKILPCVSTTVAHQRSAALVAPLGP